MDALSSAISVVRVLIRRARERMACLVAASSFPELRPDRNLLVLVTNAVVFRSRSWSLRSMGAVMTRALSASRSSQTGRTGRLMGVIPFCT